MVFNPLYGYAAAFAIGLAVAGTTQGWRYGEQIAKAETAVSTERNEAMKFILAEQEAGAARMAAADQKYTGELTDAKSQIADLELRVSTGASGLRVKAKCPVAKPVPEAGNVAGVASGSEQAPELDESARLDYFALYEGIKDLEAAVKVCVEGR